MTRSDSRRRFIRTLGMGALATPLLGSLARLAYAEDGPLPKRLLVLYSPNGTVPNAWGATGDGASLSFAPILEPLSAVKQHVTVVHGLGFGGQFNTPHSKGTMMSLTNRDVFDGRPEGTERGVMNGPSLDTVLAEDLGKNTFRDVLRLTVSNATGTNRAYFNFTRDGGFIRPQADPKAAFDFVFANATTSSPKPSMMADPCVGSLLAARKSVLDVITNDAKRMSGQLPASQRVKLDQMLEAIRGQERVLAAQDPGAPVGVACDGPTAPAEGGSFIERTKRHLDTIAAAFACDLVRFATLMMAPGADSSNLRSFRSDVQSKSYHDASHEWESAAYQPDLIKVNQYFAEQMAYIIKTLSNIPEGTGSVLDNTLILWTNECWHGTHDPFTVPVVLAGGSRLGLKGGRAFMTGKSDSQSYGKMLVSVANAVGHSMNTFGDPRWGTGPLPGLIG